MIKLTYEITPPPGSSVLRICREIALEQTVESPEECLSPEIRETVPGRILATAALSSA